MTQLYRLIYLSQLAPDFTAACVAHIVRAARLKNRLIKISGLLVFDGDRFCQYLEGDAATVGKLADQISDDSRHVDFRVLHQSAFAGPGLMSDYGLEYALNYDGCLERFESEQNSRSYELFRSLLPSFDMEPDSGF